MAGRFFGDRQFYKKIIYLMIPIMIQNGITNFVNMLDNIMVGRVGTAEMTGVAVSNQLLFVFNLCIFGAISGAGIFGAQFFGKGDQKGVRHTFRFKLIFCTLITVGAIALLFFGADALIGLYLKGEGNAADIAATLAYAKEYLFIMLIGLFPYSIAQCYSGTLRESGETVLPMVAGVTAVLVNLVLNYVLIFGNFGAPKLGVAGAAIATAISRFVECGIVMIWTRMQAKRFPFILGTYRSMYVPMALVKQIFAKGLPLMANEVMWAAGIALINQCYSVRGLDVVTATNISQTFWNVFSVAFMAVGVAIGIVVGQMLGAGETEEAKLAASRMITFSILLSAAMGLCYCVAAIWIPAAYNTTDDIRQMATRIMQISALAMPLDACAHASYFTLRSGGKTFITFIFDSGYVWLFHLPVAALLVYCTDLPILPLYLICQLLLIFKSILGLVFVAKGNWANRIVA